ncbi:hypothetical protein PINS_up012801 [Pythium insidiosum]|nr:hypothetical protein PINS_up012801 [Pythium insidiosum]
MRETARREAIEAYTSFIQLFALDGLLLWLESQPSNSSLPTTLASVPRSNYALKTLREEFDETTSIVDALRSLVEQRKSIVKNAVKGKSRDDARGKRIIPDYAFVHSRVEDEAAVRYAQRVADDVQTRVARFVSKL